jgi:hypothetical protein
MKLCIELDGPNLAIAMPIYRIVPVVVALQPLQGLKKLSGCQSLQLMYMAKELFNLNLHERLCLKAIFELQHC